MKTTKRRERRRIPDWQKAARWLETHCPEFAPRPGEAVDGLAHDLEHPVVVGDEDEEPVAVAGAGE
jgi:hypothetical protein